MKLRPVSFGPTRHFAEDSTPASARSRLANRQQEPYVASHRENFEVRNPHTRRAYRPGLRAILCLVRASRHRGITLTAIRQHGVATYI
jgi:hypothetical protein